MISLIGKAEIIIYSEEESNGNREYYFIEHNDRYLQYGKICTLSLYLFNQFKNDPTDNTNNNNENTSLKLNEMTESLKFEQLQLVYL